MRIVDTLLGKPSARDIVPTPNKSALAFQRISELSPQGISTFASTTLRETLLEHSSDYYTVALRELVERGLPHPDRPTHYKTYSSVMGTPPTSAYQLHQSENAGGNMDGVKITFDQGSFRVVETALIQDRLETILRSAGPRWELQGDQRVFDFFLEATASDLEKGRERWKLSLNEYRSRFMQDLATQVSPHAQARVNGLLLRLAHSVVPDFVIVGSIPKDKPDNKEVTLYTTLPVNESTADSISASDTHQFYQGNSIQYRSDQWRNQDEIVITTAASTPSRFSHEPFSIVIRHFMPRRFDYYNPSWLGGNHLAERRFYEPSLADGVTLTERDFANFMYGYTEHNFLIPVENRGKFNTALLADSGHILE